MTREWLPYCGAAPLPGEWLARWNLDPVLLALFAAAALWAIRRGDARAPFWAALACLALLFVSPFCALSSALFSARVAHHVLLAGVAAPLAVWGLARLRVPGSAIGWAAAHAVLFWAWHAPAPYAAALSSDALYWAMQASLFGSAMGLWASLRTASAPLGVLVLLGTMVQMGLLGALLVFAADPLYAPHWLSTVPWGFSPIEDQQLAGLILWAPGSALYLAAALAIGWRMFDAPEARPA